MPLPTRGRASNRDRTYGDIGVELSLEELHMVQLCRHGESLEVCAHAAVTYPDPTRTIIDNPKAFTQVVKQGLRAAPFVGRSAVAAMPADVTQVMPVSYQSAGEQGDDAAIAQLMRERIGDEISDFVIDYMPVQTLYTGREKLALVAICREETAVGYLELLRRAGLTVSALEIGPIAIQRLIATMQGVGSPENALVVNCGKDKSYLTLVAGDRLLADDEIDFGENGILERVCAALEMPRQLALELVNKVNLDPSVVHDDPEVRRNAEALAGIIKPDLVRLVQEIQRGLMFAASETRGARPNHVYLLGSLARWPGATALLATLADTTVSTVPSPLRLFPSLTHPQNASDSAPEFAIATGLALRRFMKRE